MSTALRQAMSRDEFFHWAEAQEERYEFDGEQPVFMTGGTRGHSRMIVRLLARLGERLTDGGFELLGQDAGIATTGDRIRYPDVLVARQGGSGSDRLIENVLVVFEVVSPSSSRMDRIVKLREYGAVDSIRTYVIIESEIEAATVFTKLPDGSWSAAPLTTEDTLALPAIDVSIPLSELYPKQPD